MFKRMKKSMIALLMLITMLVGTATVALADHVPDIDDSGRDRNHPVSLTIEHRLRGVDEPVGGAVWSLFEVQVPLDATWDGTLAQAIAQGWISSTAAATGTTCEDYGLVTLVPGNQGVFVARNISTPTGVTAPQFLVSLPAYNHVDDLNEGAGIWLYDITARPKLDGLPEGGAKILMDVDFTEEDLIASWRFDGLQLNLGLQDLMCEGLGNCVCVRCEHCVVTPENPINIVDELLCECTCLFGAEGCCNVFISFIDQMDERLTLLPATLEVYFVRNTQENVPANRVALTQGTHWVLYENPATNTFETRITRAGILHIVGADPESPNLPVRLYVDFDTRVSPVPCEGCEYHDPDCADCMDATLGRLENAGEVGYGRNHRWGPPLPPGTTNYFYNFEIAVEKVSTAIGQDGYAYRLPGAVFGLFRASDINSDTGAPYDVNRAVMRRTTGDDGIARFYQVPDHPNSVWYIYEITAPAGHVRSTTAIQVTLNRADAIYNETFVVELEVSNAPGFELPMTGGTGTVLLTIIGALLLTGATIFFVSSKRRRRV